MVFRIRQKLTAAALNAVTAGDPTTYTPTWRASGTQPAVGNGILTGRYVKVGKLVVVRINFQMFTTTTYGTGSYTWDLPFAAEAEPSFGTQWLWMGHAFAIDAGAGYRIGTVQITTAATALKVADASGNPWTNTNPNTWASTDYIGLQIAYFAA